MVDMMTWNTGHTEGKLEPLLLHNISYFTHIGLQRCNRSVRGTYTEVQVKQCRSCEFKPGA